MKKKARSILFCVLALVLSLMFAAFFAACGGTNEKDPDDHDPGKDPGGDGPATVTELVIDTPPIRRSITRARRSTLRAWS